MSAPKDPPNPPRRPPLPPPPPTEIPGGGKPIRERSVRRTLVVGGPGDPSRRVRLDVLSTITRELDEALYVVSNDLGASRAHDFGRVELVDLLAASSGLVFEQVVPDSYQQHLAPLNVILDGATSFVLGEELPAILTSDGHGAIKRFVHAVETIHSAGGPPISIVSANGDKVKLSVSADAGVAPSDDTQVEVGGHDHVAVADTAEHPPQMQAQWLVTFAGILERLDSKLRKMWVRVRHHGLVALTLNDDLFRTADSDGTRWQYVTVVAISASQSPRDTIDVLNIKPFDGELGEAAAAPIGDAASDVEATSYWIESLGRLGPKWGGERALPIEPASIKMASGFLILVASELRARGISFIKPFVAPVPNGGVQLEWERGHAYLELEFHDDGAIEFMRAYGGDKIEGESNRGTAIGLVKWFHDKVNQ